MTFYINFWTRSKKKILSSLAVAYMPTLLCKYFFDMDFYARDDEEQVILKKIDCKIYKYLPGWVSPLFLLCTEWFYNSQKFHDIELL
jgi:hypothetical protein